MAKAVIVLNKIIHCYFISYKALLFRVRIGNEDDKEDSKSSPL